jgi:hypothetical protein
LGGDVCRPGRLHRVRGKDIALAVVLALALAPSAARAGTTFDVSSTADTNTAGTLRNAINSANAAVGADAITFDGLPAGTQTITLTSALPNVTDAVTIDATGHESTPGSPNVVLTESGVSGSALQILAGPSAVKGLAIVNFPTGSGIAIGANDVTVSGDFIGIHPVTGNTSANGVGVGVFGGGPSSLTGVAIGGTAATDRNVISGNNTGIAIENADGTTIKGNLVGLSSSGTAAKPNTLGIDLSKGTAPTLTETGTVIGGDTAAARNVISGNTTAGIELDDETVSQTQIAGNYIGTNADGTAALPNARGVFLPGATSANHIGDGQAGGGNLISGNSVAGIDVGTSPDQTHVAGNLIGTAASGSGSVPNGTGILVEGGTNTLIGSLFAGTRNIVSGNLGAGVDIRNSAQTVSVRGDFIGLDVNGLRDPNQDGVVLSSAGTGNVIGGSLLGEGDVISGNTGSGVNVTGQSASILGNTIGLDPPGSDPRGNGGSGVVLAGSQNTLANNVISDNEQEGVALGGDQNHLQRNFVGTDVTGTAARGNAGAGIDVRGATSATIDGGNVLSANTKDGIEVDGPSDHLSVLGNLIGTDVNGTGPLPPQRSGVSIDASSGAVTNTTIGGTAAGQPNTIGFNAVGVRFEDPLVANESSGTSIRGNSIFGSTSGMGIDFADTGVNGLQNYPVLTSAVTSGGQTVVSGTLNSTPSSSGFLVDLYSNASCSKTGNGEAATYLGASGAISTDVNGNATFQVTLAGAVPAGQVVTATATDASADTSELSACRTVTTPPSAPVTNGTSSAPGEAPAQGSPAAGGGPVGGGGPVQLFTLPVAHLALAKKTHLLKDKAVVFTLGSDVGAQYTASGVVALPSLAARTMKLKGAKGKIAAGKRVKVKLRASRSLLATARRAFAHHRKVTATITIALKGGSGSAAPVKRKLRLTP